jgi:EAL domain-containing protein (putative c-di-GMP-specific phosphodiesterase class I)
MISDLRPHFIKLDMNLIRDVDKDVTRQSLIRSMSEFASLSNTYLIAEGIETENELLKPSISASITGRVI